MRTIRLDFDKTYFDTPGGVSGESGATEIIVNARPILAKWPDALISIHARLRDGSSYEAMPPTVPDKNYLVRYVLTDAETAIDGILTLMARAEYGDVVIKTRAIRLIISQSID